MRYTARANKMRVKDMKRDEVEVAVAQATGRASSYVAENRTPLVIGLVVVALAVAGVAGSRYWIDRKENAAQSAFAGAAKMAKDAEKPAPTPPTDGSAPAPVTTPAPTWAAVAAEYQKVHDAHPNTRAGRLAALEAGAAQLRAGDAAAAIAVLDPFVASNPHDFATAHAMSVLATAKEQAGDVPGAEALLQKLADGAYDDFAPGAAVQRLAELYERHDRPDDATKLWKRLATEAAFADTPFQATAKQKIEPAKSAVPTG
jgi:predicted negative regulator of RcsB-dependent stress response